MPRAPPATAPRRRPGRPGAGAGAGRAARPAIGPSPSPRAPRRRGGSESDGPKNSNQNNPWCNVSARGPGSGLRRLQPLRDPPLQLTALSLSSLRSSLASTQPQRHHIMHTQHICPRRAALTTPAHDDEDPRPARHFLLFFFDALPTFSTSSPLTGRMCGDSVSAAAGASSCAGSFPHMRVRKRLLSFSMRFRSWC